MEHKQERRGTARTKVVPPLPTLQSENWRVPSHSPVPDMPALRAFSAGNPALAGLLCTHRSSRGGTHVLGSSSASQHTHLLAVHLSLLRTCMVTLNYTRIRVRFTR